MSDQNSGTMPKELLDQDEGARLSAIFSLLGRARSDSDVTGRLVYLAYQLAQGADADKVKTAWRLLVVAAIEADDLDGLRTLAAGLEER